MEDEAVIDTTKIFYEFQLTKCPACGSENYESQIRATVSKEDFEMLSLEETPLRSVPAELENHLTCQDCSHEWTEESITKSP